VSADLWFPVRVHPHIQADTGINPTAAISSIIFYIFFIDLFGRRNPWMLSAGLCCLCLIYVGAYVKIGHPDASPLPLSSSTKKGGDAATAMIMLYSIFWAFGGNGLPWIVSAEVGGSRLAKHTPSKRSTAADL
jgi:hypothetical protein